MKICWKTLLMYTVLSQQSLRSTRDIQLFLKTKKIQNQFCFKYASDNEKKKQIMKSICTKEATDKGDLADKVIKENKRKHV